MYHYGSYIHENCTCHLDVRKNLVIVTQSDTSDTPIADVSEKLATDVCETYNIDKTTLIWIERVAEEYHLVFFNLTGGKFSTPRHVPIDAKIVDLFSETY